MSVAHFNAGEGLLGKEAEEIGSVLHAMPQDLWFFDVRSDVSGLCEGLKSGIVSSASGKAMRSQEE